jgi:hypothetical protein
MNIFTPRKPERNGQLLSLACIAALMLIGSYSTTAQVMASFTSGSGLTYFQNFDAIGSTAPTNLPNGWQWQAGATPVFAQSPATANRQAGSVAGTSGTGILTSASSGNTYNFANGVNSSSTDRALGILGSSTVGERSLMMGFINSTGSAITGLTLSWNYEKYRSGSRAFNWTFYYSLDRTNWTSVTAGDQAYSADANNTTIFNPPTSITKSNVSISGLNMANGDSIFLRWDYLGVGGTSNGQALAIDSFTAVASVPTGCTPPAQVTFGTPATTTSSASLSYTGLTNNVLIVAHAGAAPGNPPVNGTSYTAGTSLGGGDFVAYVGSSSSTTVSNLTPNTQYYFKAYSFDPTGFTGSTPCYNATSPPLVSATTASCLSSQASSFTASNIQGTSLDLSWTTPSGAQVLVLKNTGSTAITDAPTQGSTYTTGATIGSSTVAYVGSASGITLTGLTTSTQYQFAIFAFDPSGYSSNPCYQTPAATLSTTTGPCNSAAQIGGLTSGTTTTYSIPLSWNTPANQIIILQRAGSAVTGSPVNSTSYTVGNTIGSDVVAYVGSASSATITGLTPATGYYFKAFAFDPTGFTGNTPCYNTTSGPTLSSVTTANCTGGSQISGLSSSNVQGTGTDLSWTLPGGINVIILQKTGASAVPATSYPVSGNTYTAGTSMGSGVTVAYAGSAATASISGLSTSTLYHFEAFAFDPTGYNGQACYNLASPATLNVTTAACNGGTQIASLATSNATTSSINLSWTTPSNQVIILQNAGGAVADAPVNGTSYTAGATINAATVAYVGSASGVTISMLQPGTSYNFKAFAFDPTGFTGGTPCYNILSAPAANLNTSACQSTQASGFSASFPTATSIDLGITVPTGAKVIVLMRSGSPVQSNFPVNGTAYVAGQSIGPNTVAYVGTASSTIINGLTPSTTYYFMAFAFDSTGYAGNTPCYLYANAPSVNKTTNSCGTPSSGPTNLSFSNVSSNSMTINWTRGNGGRRVVIINTSNSFTAPSNGNDPTANTAYSGSGQQVVYNGSGETVTVTGLSAGTTYYVAIYEASCTGTNVQFNTSSPLTGSQNTPVVLPVALRSFTATATANCNNIIWESEVETRGLRYDLQRSGNGADFATIAAYTGRGTASRYSYCDANPLAGRNCYRLRMLEPGGAEQFSKIVLIDGTQVGFSLSVYPNPVKDLLFIGVKQADGKAHIELMDINGRMLQFLAVEGEQSSIDMSALTPGCYLLRYQDNSRNEVIRITK